MPLDGRFDVEPPMTPALAQQAGAILIDGVPVGSMGLHLVGADLGSAELATSFQDVPGVAGGVDLSLEDETGCAYQGRREMAFSLRTFARSDKRAKVKTALGAYAGKTVRVFYRPMNLMAKGRLSVGSWSDEVGWSDVDVTLLAEPNLRGPAANVEIAEGQTAITVSGNAPAPIRARVRPAGLKSVAVDLDGKAAVRVDSASTFGQSSVLVIDSDGRTCKLDGALVAPTLESDWLVATPGRHVITLSGGTGMATIPELWRI